jgi:predicted metal-dependent peptidase
VPGHWRPWADDVLDPVLDWRQLLRSAVRRGVASVAGKVDFTYRRPSRRASSVAGVVLPALHQPAPRIAVVIDTSASIDEAMLGRVLGEVAGLLSGLGVGRSDLRVICCDARAYRAQRVFDARDVRLVGGGGTDVGAGIRAAGELY